ncbi:uncharacterized protein TRIADDRAFT_56682 [Trichoplax adhaerens]|uniref:C-type lectin domain-containing protein n=1 Tax=Trichoplax adhaerens TaxID=10228 RepID=B3RWA8_TRIAD|nr:hypothetical protein TRIADDRAFT_56682 [Trichoplax adhaerens]EDV24661.1 hypothetical protein TRIADDRAFT_56682 [Trichoplax adhaerens]|eukprot:XP_002112551.1 hypothetical protein TRIADDRAFT_56682 [Trichoplax adhaerens]
MNFDRNCDYDIEYRNRGFTFYEDFQNWTNSRKSCIDKGGDLAIINNAELATVFDSYYHGKTMYIGLRDLYDFNISTQFVWVDALNTSTNLNSDNPFLVSSSLHYFYSRQQSSFPTIDKNIVKDTYIYATWDNELQVQSDCEKLVSRRSHPSIL